MALKYVEGQSNVWADMLSRSHGQKGTKTSADSTPADRVLKVKGSDLHVYVPSWCLNEIDGWQPIPKTHTPQSTYCHKRMVEVFFAYHSTSTIPTEMNCDHINIAAEQLTDNLISKIIQALQTKDPSQEYHMDPEDHRTSLFGKHLQNFNLETGTSVLMIRDSTHTPKLVVPNKLRRRFLYQAHDCIIYSGVTRMRAYRVNYWWEYKSRYIEAYVESCEICAKQKGNYGKRRHWPIGHCKQGKRPFDIIYVDLISIPVSKRKGYILAILDSFSRHPAGNTPNRIVILLLLGDINNVTLSATIFYSFCRHM